MARYTKLLMVALILGLSWGVLFSQHLVYADDPDRVIPTIGVGSLTAGTIDVLWSTPTDAPRDYRLTWGKQNAQGEYDYASWSAENSSTAGNAYPSASATSYTITGLDAGTYKAMIRARYDDNLSGEWNASSSVGVAGGTVPRDPPTPDPTAVVVTPTPEPTPEIAFSHDGGADHPVTLPAPQDSRRVLVSKINQAAADGHTLTENQKKTYIIKVPSSGYGFNVQTITLRIRDFDSGDKLQVFVTHGGGATLNDSIHLRFNEVTSVSNDIVTLNVDGASVVFPASQSQQLNLYGLVIKAAEGSFTVGETDAGGYDNGSMDGWTLTRVQAMIVGKKRIKTEAFGTPEPTPTPTIPNCYAEPPPSGCAHPGSTASATRLTLGTTASGRLYSSQSEKLYKVALAAGTKYKITVHGENTSDKTLRNPKVAVLAHSVVLGDGGLPELGGIQIQTLGLKNAVLDDRNRITDPGIGLASFQGGRVDFRYANVKTPCIRNDESACTSKIFSQGSLRTLAHLTKYKYEYPDYYYIRVSSANTGSFSITVDTTTENLGSNGGDDSVQGLHTLPAISFQNGFTTTQGSDTLKPRKLDFAGDRDWFRLNLGIANYCTVSVGGWGLGPIASIDIINGGTGVESSFVGSSNSAIEVTGGTGANILTTVSEMDSGADHTISGFLINSGGSGYSPDSEVVVDSDYGGTGYKFKVNVTLPDSAASNLQMQLGSRTGTSFVVKKPGYSKAGAVDGTGLLRVHSTSDDTRDYRVFVSDCGYATLEERGVGSTIHNPIQLVSSQSISKPGPGRSVTVTGTRDNTPRTITDGVPDTTTECTSGCRIPRYWHKIILTGYHHDGTSVINAGRKYKIAVSGALSNAAILIVPSVIKLEATGTGSSRSPVTDADGNYTVLESCQKPETFAQLSNSLSTGDSKVIEEFAPYYRTTSGSALHKFRVVYSADSVRRENNWNVPQNCFFINVYSISESAGSYTLTVTDIGSQ